MGYFNYMKITKELETQDKTKDKCTISTQRYPHVRTVLRNVLLERSTLENVMDTMSRNVGNQLTNYNAQHPRTAKNQHTFLSFSLKNAS